MVEYSLRAWCSYGIMGIRLLSGNLQEMELLPVHV